MSNKRRATITISEELVKRCHEHEDGGNLSRMVSAALEAYYFHPSELERFVFEMRTELRVARTSMNRIARHLGYVEAMLDQMELPADLEKRVIARGRKHTGEENASEKVNDREKL